MTYNFKIKISGHFIKDLQLIERRNSNVTVTSNSWMFIYFKENQLGLKSEFITRRHDQPKKVYYWVDGESNRVLNLEGGFTLLPTVPYMCASFIKSDSKFNCGVVLVGK